MSVRHACGLIMALSLTGLLSPGTPDARACDPSEWARAEFGAGKGTSLPAHPDAAVSAGGAAASDPVWSTRAPLSIPRQEVAVAELAGKIYVVGGIDGGPAFLSSVEVYDPDTDAWSPGPSLPTPLHHTTASVAGGKLYVIGGWADFFATPLDVVYELDPAVGSWVAKASMPTSRGSPAATALGGKIYVGGGSPTARSRDFAVYDPALDSWRTLPDLPSGRNHLGLAAAAGRILVVGGRTSLQAGVGNVASVDVFDPVSETWSSAAPLPRARGGLASVGVGSLVFAFGGEGNAANPDGTFEDADVYDVSSDSWSSLAPMPTPRHGIGAVVLDGRVHIPGGGPIQNFSVSDVHERLDVTSLLSPSVPVLLPAGVLTLGAMLLGAARWATRPRRANPRDRDDAPGIGSVPS